MGEIVGYFLPLLPDFFLPYFVTSPLITRFSWDAQMPLPHHSVMVVIFLMVVVNKAESVF